MGKISDTSKYPVVTPAGTDMVIGTDVGSSNATKNFTIDSIIGLGSTYTFSNVGTDAAMRLRLSDGTTDSDVNIVPGTGINLSSSSATLANINLDIPVTIAHGGTGLTAAGTKGHVMKSTGAALEMKSRDGIFATLTSGATVAWNYRDGSNAYLDLGAGNADILSITNIEDGDHGTLILNGAVNQTFQLPNDGSTVKSLITGGGSYGPSANIDRLDFVARVDGGATSFYWTITSNLQFYTP
tara:strand:+ start:2299 stop:3021 length:723 start_codon:yes stop_codon:yes gene_type:complete